MTTPTGAEHTGRHRPWVVHAVIWVALLVVSAGLVVTALSPGAGSTGAQDGVGAHSVTSRGPAAAVPPRTSYAASENSSDAQPLQAEKRDPASSPRLRKYIDPNRPEAALMLLPAWRWQGSADLGSVMLPKDRASTKLFDFNLPEMFSTLLVTITNTLWRVIMKVMHWALTMDLLDSALAHVNGIFSSLANGVFSSGVAAILMLVAFIFAWKALLKGRQQRMVAIIIMTLVPLAAMQLLATKIDGGQTAAGQYPHFSPAWIAKTGSGYANEIGGQTMVKLTEKAKITHAQTANTYPASAGSPSCAEYVAQLYQAYNSTVKADASQAGKQADGVGMLQKAPSLVLLSKMWEEGFLVPWKSAQYGSSPEAEYLYCHKLEARAGISAEEQFQMVGGPALAAGAAGRTAKIPKSTSGYSGFGIGPFVNFRTKTDTAGYNARWQAAWAACGAEQGTKARGGWTQLNVLGTRMQDGFCQNWKVSTTPQGYLDNGSVATDESLTALFAVGKSECQVDGWGAADAKASVTVPVPVPGAGTVTVGGDVPGSGAAKDAAKKVADWFTDRQENQLAQCKDAAAADASTPASTTDTAAVQPLPEGQKLQPLYFPNANGIDGNTESHGDPDAVAAQKLDVRAAMKGMTGQNTGDRMLEVVSAFITACAYAWAFIFLGLGAMVAQVGLAILLALLPVTLVLLAIPSERAKASAGFRMLRLTIAMMGAKVVLLACISFLIIVTSIISGALGGWSGGLSAMIAPIAALILLRMILKTLGFGNLTSPAGALGLATAGAAALGGDKAMAKTLAKGATKPQEQAKKGLRSARQFHDRQLARNYRKQRLADMGAKKKLTARQPDGTTAPALPGGTGRFASLIPASMRGKKARTPFDVPRDPKTGLPITPPGGKGDPMAGPDGRAGVLGAAAGGAMAAGMGAIDRAGVVGADLPGAEGHKLTTEESRALRDKVAGDKARADAGDSRDQYMLEHSGADARAVAAGAADLFNGAMLSPATVEARTNEATAAMGIPGVNARANSMALPTTICGAGDGYLPIDIDPAAFKALPEEEKFLTAQRVAALVSEHPEMALPMDQIQVQAQGMARQLGIDIADAENLAIAATLTHRSVGLAEVNGDGTISMADISELVGVPRATSLQDGGAELIAWTQNLLDNHGTSDAIQEFVVNVQRDMDSGVNMANAQMAFAATVAQAHRQAAPGITEVVVTADLAMDRNNYADAACEALRSKVNEVLSGSLDFSAGGADAVRVAFDRAKECLAASQVADAIAKVEIKCATDPGFSRERAIAEAKAHVDAGVDAMGAAFTDFYTSAARSGDVISSFNASDFKTVLDNAQMNLSNQHQLLEREIAEFYDRPVRDPLALGAA